LFLHPPTQELLGRAISLQQWEQNPIRTPGAKMTFHMQAWLWRLAEAIAGAGAENDQVFENWDQVADQW
jgi:hypothetical protein